MCKSVLYLYTYEDRIPSKRSEKIALFRFIVKIRFNLLSSKENVNVTLVLHVSQNDKGVGHILTRKN